MDIGVEEIKGESYGGDVYWKVCFSRGGVVEEVERVDDCVVEVMEEVRWEEEERFGIVRVVVKGEEEECEL